MAQNEFTDFELDVDLSGDDVRAWGGEQRPLVPPGDYTLTITHLESTTAESSGNPMIAVTFDVADEGEHNGAKIYNNYSLSPKAIGRLKQLMIACGANLAKFVASELLGQTIRASVIHTESAGKVDSEGNTKGPRTFANVINEQPLEEQKPAETKTATKPPVTNKPGATAATATAATTKAANGAARRA